jgi:hypothetical protein
LQKFRTAKRTGNESDKLFGNHLQELQNYYLDSKEISSFESLKSDMLLEQFISTLPPDVKSFVLARRAMTIVEASDFADLAFQGSVKRHNGGKVRANFKVDSQPQQSMQISIVTEGQVKVSVNEAFEGVNKQGVVKPPIICFDCSGPQNESQRPKQKDKTLLNAGTKVLTCFSCGGKGKGHKSGSPLCKSKTGQALQENYHVKETREKNLHENRFAIPLNVNGVECCSLSDTGTSCSLVNLKTMCHCIKPIESRWCMIIRGVTGQQTIPVADELLFSSHFKCNNPVTVTV